jgi:DNA-binding MarR family transcriptional regulator
MKPDKDDDFDTEISEEEYERRVAIIEGILNDMIAEGMVQRTVDEKDGQYLYSLTEAGAKVAAQASFADKLALLVPGLSP